MDTKNWINHDSNNPPALAPAAYVKAQVYTLDKSAFSLQVRTVKSVPWRRCDKYHPITDPEGIPYCSAEGLEPWAEYVATDACGCCIRQFGSKPYPGESLMWRRSELNEMWSFATANHRHPGNWRDSLMRVWRRK